MYIFQNHNITMEIIEKKLLGKICFINLSINRFNYKNKNNITNIQIYKYKSDFYLFILSNINTNINTNILLQKVIRKNTKSNTKEYKRDSKRYCNTKLI